ncbi:biotin/lipoate--protein ligase family protein [Methylobacterium sp. A54F]
MTAYAASSEAADLLLPPLFSGLRLAAPEAVFAEALRRAGPDEAGLLVHAESDRALALAVVLAPEEPLRTARRAFLAGMAALAEAVGTHAPPEKAVRFGWPDSLHFNEARLGGGRLAWPEGCAEEAVPDWLVFGAMLIAGKADDGDPGLTPDSTSIADEGFEIASRDVILESFARYLMKFFAVWAEDGFEPVARRYLRYLGGDSATLSPEGDLRAAGGATEPLMPALRAPSWLDPLTGRPRL